jgi:hypothetical protein
MRWKNALITSTSFPGLRDQKVLKVRKVNSVPRDQLVLMALQVRKVSKDPWDLKV